jgi:hypothetical protein
MARKVRFDLLGVGPGVGRSLCDLDAAGLTAPADLDLRLDDGHAADPLGDGLGLVGGRRDRAEADRYAELLEQLLGLILEQIHADTSSSGAVVALRPTNGH